MSDDEPKVASGLRLTEAANVEVGTEMGARVITFEWADGPFDQTDWDIVVRGEAFTTRRGRAAVYAVDRKTGEVVGCVLEGDKVIVAD